MKIYRKTGVLLLVLALALTTYGCKGKLSEPEMEVMNLKYDLAEDENLEPFYASETKIYAGVLKKEPPSRLAPRFGVTTEKFIVYDIENERIEVQYEPEDEGIYLYHAMPFEDGIIYAAYTLPEPDASIDDSIPWYIKYVSDEGTRVLDSGRCSDKFSMPAFALLDGEVYYLYEIFDGNTECGFGISRADLYNPEIVVEEKNYRLSESEFYANGTDFVVLVEDGKHSFLIGNAEGIYREYDLPEQMSNFAICKDYLFCCTTSDGHKWTARSISLKTGEEYTVETEGPIYRIASMTGDELACIVDEWDMHIFRPGKKFEMIPVESSEKEFHESRESVRYYPYGDTKTFAQLDDTKFCRITW